MGSHTITRPANGVLLEFEFPVGQSTLRNDVVLFWLAPDGTEREYATFAAGAAGQIVHTQATFEGDAWLVRDAPAKGQVGEVLLRHVATGALTQRVIVRDSRARAADGGGSASLGKRPASGVGDGAAGSSSRGHAAAAAADDDALDEELQRALALSLADHTATGDAREAPPAAATADAREAPPAAAAEPARAPPPAEHALSASDARALSLQLAAQAAATARALAALPSPTAPQAEARLQCRFPDLDAPALSVRLVASASLQPLFDAILAHVEAAEAAAVGAAWSELRVSCRAPPLALTLARSGLVREAAETLGSRLDGTVESLGLLPSAVLHITRVAGATAETE